ncbi:MAG: DNA topoisomerase (ATP-hydrolyzing) subunit A, partial [Treponema sp.]
MDEIQTPEGGTLIKIPIEAEVKQAYIDYSMSVIVQRALPDVRDGLKPVHRRILYAMDELHLGNSSPTRKCAKIVGDVLGKYHPHGDASVYDALVRLGQDFAQRYTVITPQGNFGTIAGDPAAAYRYTEAKMAKLAEEMVSDIDKETVDMIANFDETTKEPTVLPAKFPFLLCNGTTGIAVGMATNMPPHNLREVAAAVGAYIDNPEISIDELCNYIKGPDFPTGGIIYGKAGIKKAYKTGRGKITIRGKFSIETAKGGKESIVFTEVPYGVNTTNLVNRIKDLARDKVVDGIVGVNDETSDRAGMRLVIDLKRGAITKVILNTLFAKTDLQSNFGVINLALVKGRPEVLTLKHIIQYFVEHRDEVITRRTQFDLRKALERAHILEALIVAINNIDEVIKIIRGSRDTESAKLALRERFDFDDVQAQAIVDMQLKRLTHLQIEDLKK